MGPASLSEQAESSAHPSEYVAAVGLLLGIFLFKPSIFGQIKYIILSYIVLGIIFGQFFINYAIFVIAVLSILEIVSWIKIVRAWQRNHSVLIVLQQVI